MKMVRAIVRPESTENVVEGLAASGFVALTKVQAFGRGKQKGLDSGSVHYDELPKNLLMMVVEDEHVEQVLLAPVEARLADEHQRKSEETAATRVDFFTMVRGED